MSHSWTAAAVRTITPACLPGSAMFRPKTALKLHWSILLTLQVRLVGHYIDFWGSCRGLNSCKVIICFKYGVVFAVKVKSWLQMLSCNPFKQKNNTWAFYRAQVDYLQLCLAQTTAFNKCKPIGHRSLVPLGSQQFLLLSTQIIITVFTNCFFHLGFRSSSTNSGSPCGRPQALLLSHLLVQPSARPAAGDCCLCCMPLAHSFPTLFVCVYKLL